MKFAKFISEECAAGAPDTKDGQPYTEEMARADGFLPLIVEKVDDSIQNRKAMYKIENNTIIEYYVEDDTIKEPTNMEILNENMPSDEELSTLTAEELKRRGIVLN